MNTRLELVGGERQPRPKIGEIVELLIGPELPVRFSAYDGSATGKEESTISLRLENERGLRYIATAPGELGLVRAYLAGDLVLDGVNPGDPYELMSIIADDLKFRMPSPDTALRVARGLGLGVLHRPELPPEEVLPQWQRTLRGIKHSKTRDAEVIHHHYDVSNRFYELVLGDSMTYTCACYPDLDASLETAQDAKYALVAGKLGLKPGMRLLDVGCGWGGMVRHAAKRGVKALGVTLSAEQADWAQRKIDEEGLGDLAEVRHMDYRDVQESEFDAVSSIGLTEHIGIAHYLAYFRFLRSRLRTGGRLLNHCITMPNDRKRVERNGIINRYVFPDGELASAGHIIRVMERVGLEPRHEENLREHYAMTLRDWNANLAANWDEAVAEAGENRARIWGLYMAGSRLAFERNEIQLHQVLATKTADTGDSSFPLRPDW